MCNQVKIQKETLKLILEDLHENACEFCCNPEYKELKELVDTE
jgi:hypothetical protein